MMLLDSRVGHASIDVIVTALEKYITAHTVRNDHGFMTYIGKPIRLEQYKEMVRYQERGGKLLR